MSCQGGVYPNMTSISVNNTVERAKTKVTSRAISSPLFLRKRRPQGRPAASFWWWVQ